MADFNVNPEFINKRNNKKKLQAKRRKLIITVLTVLLVAAILVSVIAVIASNKQPANQLPTTAAPATSQITSDTQDNHETKIPDNTNTPVVPLPTNPETTLPPIKKHLTTVYIDAGHGATNSYGVLDRGAGSDTIYNQISNKYEDDLNLEIALKLKTIFEDAGYAVIMFRESTIDEHITVMDRAKMVNNTDADVFVSIHGNSSSAKSACGARIIYWNQRSDKSDCLKLANSIKKEIESFGTTLSQKPVGIISDDVYVVVNTKVPAVLVETCFITNKEDAERACNPEWQQNMAQAIFDGISAVHPLEITYR